MRCSMIKSVFLVGGAVRDMFIFGVDPKDRDYVVVGSTPEEMLAQGFSQVGADFPVFLHPETGDEYALARTEAKDGLGYNGFSVNFEPTISLEEDLKRRDFTINALAFADNAIIDPFGGIEDGKKRILRHVSTGSFTEDPVRILRAARFMARFGPEWKLAPETKMLIREASNENLLRELTAERVWKEMNRALTEPFPRLFFDTLRENDALLDIFPEVYFLETCKEHPIYHPEGNTYEHTMLVLTQASLQFPGDLRAAFCALVHDFGKIAIPAEEHPRFKMHDIKGVPLVRNFCDKNKVPSELKKEALAATEFHMRGHLLKDMKAKSFVKMFTKMDAKRHPARIKALYKTIRCDTRGRLGHENDDLSDKEILLEAYDGFKSVTFESAGCVVGMPVEKIKAKLYTAQIKAVHEKLRENE